MPKARRHVLKWRSLDDGSDDRPWRMIAEGRGIVYVITHTVHAPVGDGAESPEDGYDFATLTAVEGDVVHPPVHFPMGGTINGAPLPYVGMLRATNLAQSVEDGEHCLAG